jgi:hypothetical protein
MKQIAVAAGILAALTWQDRAFCEVPLGEGAGWKMSTDGRVNAFISIARGNGIPEHQPDYVGTITKDTKDTDEQLRSTRIRNGFMASILGFTAHKDVSEEFKVTARAALWMNISTTRTKNTPGAVDPRELYGKLEGSWGSLLGGSALALFGRGGILVDADIAHDYGLGYPCMIENASGGACGMAAFGAIFPSFEPGFVYTTPKAGGFELSLGVYDPANVANGQLNRTPLPRLEAEATFAVQDVVKLFASGFWQTLEGTPPDPNNPGKLMDINATAWGGQAGLMLTAGPVMVGGAAFTGQGLSPITYLEESQTPFDAKGVPRKSRGGFGLGALTFESIHLKLAGGAGLFHLDKSPNDPEPISATGAPGNPQLLKQNLGFTVGFYQTTGPVHFALEYFRAQHTLYEYGEARADDPTLIDIKKPTQAVNFVNAGFTVVW